ncbi:WXG100 family type VII secretion target [Mycobacterium hodleri]|uniref:WXG100 family type VII secretion target n=1 Tax=Mycolicibacterium hodleri TaxID=49897 RepID=A0A544W5U1_9MYCO|nr:WXG100 family type VII secretion target [Mycolicibacterium hodleri]TQR87614.1 WXG100 family type VII secretion target [Mycolicibacterium hodleri]
MGQSVELVESELHAASARLESAAQRLKDGLASVNDETTQLLGSGWKGGAASAYGPAWDGWHEGAEQVVQALQRMSELLSIAGKEYAKTDQAGADALGSTVQTSGGATDSGASGGSGAPSPQSPPDLALGGPSGTSGTSGGSVGGQSGDIGQQAMSSVSQLGQAAAGMAQQSGQAVAGLAQQAAQLAMGLAQQAGQAHGTEDAQTDKADAPATDAPAAQGAEDGDEDKKDEEHEREEAEKRDRERDGAAAPSGERSTGTAPVDRGDVTPTPKDKAIKRTL